MGGGGGGSNNKKDHAACKNPRCPLSFLFFFVLFQNTFKIDVFVPNLVKNVSSKKNKKDHDFRIFLIFYVLFCSFLLFFPDLVNKMSSNREQKRTKKIMPPGKSQDVLCLFCCWTPPPICGSVHKFCFRIREYLAMYFYFSISLVVLKLSVARHVT